MDVKKHNLIELVFNVPPLWDKRHKQHHNRYTLAKEWKKIGAELEMTVTEVKSRWKNLRQEFGKQFKKYQGRSGDGAPEEAASQWPFFQKLQFLKDQFTPRNSSGNLTRPENTEETENTQNTENTEEVSDSDDVDEERDIRQESVDSVFSSHGLESTSDRQPFLQTPTSLSSEPQSVSRTGYRKRLTAQAIIGKELLSLETQKLELAKKRKIQNVNDEDIGFFNSLLPTVKKLTDKDKFIFRMKVQKTLFELAFPETENPKVSNAKPSTTVQTSTSRHNQITQEETIIQQESDTYTTDYTILEL
ncbi:transcription factor Adf-1-like [Photinus pyralis]|uniref:transcription factor Adf-1-like n=1 Tax=Photinus pyralis TaxID=7054 RepID=UPI00126726D9|nr:transcription factor Adf-1-like [Photinus pyralis]